jgi:hypothetical protein
MRRAKQWVCPKSRQRDCSANVEELTLSTFARNDADVVLLTSGGLSDGNAKLTAALLGEHCDALLEEREQEVDLVRWRRDETSPLDCSSDPQDLFCFFVAASLPNAHRCVAKAASDQRADLGSEEAIRRCFHFFLEHRVDLG